MIAAIALGVVIVDQITKRLVIAKLLPGQSATVCPGFFNLTHVRNTGAVWGTLQDQNIWLVLLSILAMIFLAAAARRMRDSSCQLAAAGLLLGGILGNLIDRLRFGWVIDFLDFYLGTRHWPAFNFADIALCCGAMLYALASLFTSALRQTATN